MKKLFLVLFCASAIQGISQQRLTLTDAINQALKNSYDIQLAQNSLDISVINNSAGVAGGLPTVTAGANDNETITSINQKFPDPSRDTKRSNVGSNNLTANVTGSILLYNGLRVQSTRERLDQLEKQNQQLLASQVQNTIAAVMAKYFDVVRQQYFLQALDRTIEVSRQKLTILEVRKEVGVANNADIFQAN
jgi:outer membrane protein TolC